MASQNHGPSTTSLCTPLLSDSIAPTRAVNGHANHDAASTCDAGSGDPFAFLSEEQPPRDRGPSPADPFRNATPAWGGGLYAWVRTLLCAPVAAVRLVLFGLAIAVGYAATWVALRGWANVRSSSSTRGRLPPQVVLLVAWPSSSTRGHGPAPRVASREVIVGCGEKRETCRYMRRWGSFPKRGTGCERCWALYASCCLRKEGYEGRIRLLLETA